MAVILENGSGVVGANANVDSDYVTAYLTARNRQTENGWSSSGGTAEDAACVAATDYVELRFSLEFKGSREFANLNVARSTLTFTQNAGDTETVTVGTIVYQLVNTLVATNDVLIAANASDTLSNLVDAINANQDTAGTSFEASTVANADGNAFVFIGDAIVVFAQAQGTPGNLVATTSTVTGGTWNFPTLNGGNDIVVPQPLSFPRSSLFTRDGVAVIGMPDPLKMATAEYAVRARRGTPALAPDPTLDSYGGLVEATKEKVGPIEEEFEYTPGTASTGRLTPYPAADRMLSEYLLSSGGASAVR